MIDSAEFCVRRSGRFLVTELRAPYRVISTSACNGGQSENIRFLINHQSCEGSGHHDRALCLIKMGLEKYHQSICDELGIPADATASMGTAANMNYAVIRQCGNDDISVTAIVTAGVQGNAACAGDPATWAETPQEPSEAGLQNGTINIELLLSCPVTEGALVAGGGDHDGGQKCGPAAAGCAQPLFHGSGYGHNHRSVLRCGVLAGFGPAPVHLYRNQAGGIHWSFGSRCDPGSASLA